MSKTNKIKKFENLKKLDCLICGYYFNQENYPIICLAAVKTHLGYCPEKINVVLHKKPVVNSIEVVNQNPPNLFNFWNIFKNPLLSKFQYQGRVGRAFDSLGEYLIKNKKTWIVIEEIV